MMRSLRMTRDVAFKKVFFTKQWNHRKNFPKPTLARPSAAQAYQTKEKEKEDEVVYYLY